MGLFDLFIDRGEPTPATPVAPTAPTAVGSTPIVATTTTTESSNADMYNEIMGELQKTKSVGYGYMDFKSALKNMEALPLPEDQKYKAVWAIISSQGVSVNAVVTSIATYQASLKQINAKVEADLKGMGNKEVTLRKTQAEEVAKQITMATELIKEQTQKITELQEQKSLLEKQAQESELKIARIQSGYASTVKTIADAMDSDSAKITNYIGVK